jgi:hypothetical protein
MPRKLRMLFRDLERAGKHGDPLPPPTVGRVERVIDNTSLAAE